VDDAGLTGYGHAQARAAAQSLARERIDAIYASPLRRAQETAAPLAEATGLEVTTLDGLAEIHAKWGGLTQEEVDAHFVHAMGRPLPEFWEGFPGGESFRDFHARVTGCLGDILLRHGLRSERSGDFSVWHPSREGSSIVIVAHGGTNGVLATHLLDVRPVPWEWLRFEMELAAYAVLQARGVGDRGCVWSLVNFNEVDHLRGAGLR
jgi:probable phosphoglycerate mutase